VSARRPRKPGARDRTPPPGYHPYIVVKFEPNLGRPHAQDIPTWLRHSSSIDAWEELETWLPEFRIQDVFPGAVEGKLAGLVELAKQRDPSYAKLPPPRFEDYFRIAIPPRVDGAELVRAIRRFDVVELAYVEPPPLPPPVDESDDPEAAKQFFLGAAADPTASGAWSSIDARAAWDYDGGDGAKQAFVDLERGWLLDHDDLDEHGISIISGLNELYPSHGTSVLGIVAARDNKIGCIGIAPAVASVRVVGQCRSTGEYHVDEAIQSAIENMAFGDVLLIEADSDFEPESPPGAPCDFYYGLPVEIQDAVFQMIRLATALGIVVIEAAGDDHENLDVVKDALGNKVFDRSDPIGFRDSGAIVVGAASSTQPHRSLGKSSYGNRVDFFAWGENVYTLADDPATAGKSDYETNFEDTSAAAAIIAGAALVVQGLAEESLKRRLGPWQLRELLAEGATILDPAETEKLGVMPNLRAIVSGGTLNLAPDVYVRDFVCDVGNPHEEFVSASPDVIVTAIAVTDPQAAYGEGSGTEELETIGSSVTRGVDHHVYVRMRNRGGSDAENVEATVYWAEPATLLTPDSWNLLGSTILPKVPAGDALTVSNDIAWPAASIPADGHYCFVVTVHHAKDPAPLPPTGSSFDWSQFEAYIRRNNNVTWRNFNVASLDATTGEAVLGFQFAGAGEEDIPWFGIEVIGRLPRGSKLTLEVPGALGRALRPGLFAAQPAKNGEMAVVQLVPWATNRLGEVPMGRGVRHRAKLHVWIPPEARGGRHRLHARQTFKGREVGRVSWLIEPPK